MDVPRKFINVLAIGDQIEPDSQISRIYDPILKNSRICLEIYFTVVYSLADL